jgi:hypothetical protein
MTQSSLVRKNDQFAQKLKSAVNLILDSSKKRPYLSSPWAQYFVFTTGRIRKQKTEISGVEWALPTIIPRQ